MREHRLRALLLLAFVGAAFPSGATADQASQPSSPEAGLIATGKYQSCAVRAAVVRCWGYGGDGQLGYGITESIGDDETPASIGPVDVGPGRTVKAISAGGVHTCGLLDDGSVRCWGFGGDGRLGYGNTNSIGGSQAPGSAGPVDLGPGRTATAISAGGGHSCAVLDDGTVRCWGFGGDGRLGYGNTSNIGDDETPGSAGPVDLGPGRTAKAVTAGDGHSCALLDDNSVRCWGFGGFGRLGYGNSDNVGDTETPGSAGPVDVGPGRTVKAISAGVVHTCAVLDDGTVRCWGSGASGRLGYGDIDTVGRTQTPGAVGPVDLGPGRTARAISAGGEHTCALLDDGTVRCWGNGGFGQLGYGNASSVGDSQAPGSVGPVDLGSGRSAVAISTGELHTCAQLDDSSLRCWGFGANGRLGYCNQVSVGDDEAPGARGPVDLGAGGAGCPAAPTPTPGGVEPPAPAETPTPTPMPTLPAAGGDETVDPREQEAMRARRLRTCLRAANKRTRRARRERARKACLKRFGRTPGRIEDLEVRKLSRTRVVLTFAAPGSDGSDPPAARAYLIKQSRRPMRNRPAFRRAKALCKGSCRFKATKVGTKIKLTVTNLRRRSTFYYAVAARDNVSRRPGPRSRTVKIRLR